MEFKARRAMEHRRSVGGIWDYMSKSALPELRIKSTTKGQLRMLSVAVGITAVLGLRLASTSGWNSGPYTWPLMGVTALGAVVFGLRIVVPSTLTLDSTGLTWTVVGWPSRRLRWADIDTFGVVPPRPPLIDPLIGYNLTSSEGPGLGIGSGWTGYDATISGGWELGAEKLVETLEEYRRAASK